jgi:hypothetical protein
MHGVPRDLPVDSFIGKEFNQVCLGRFQVQFHASGTGSILIEGHWELRDQTGALVDSDKEHAERKCFYLHLIIDVPIIQVKVEPPRSFSLCFQSGLILTVFDDSLHYESFSLHLDGRGSIYV